MEGRFPRGSPPVVKIWLEVIYGPLNMPNNLHAITYYYSNTLPKFDGEKDFIVEDHMPTFQDFTHNFLIKYVYVYMRLFVQTLEAEVRKWISDLLANYLNYWNSFEQYFMR